MVVTVWPICARCVIRRRCSGRSRLTRPRFGSSTRSRETLRGSIGCGPRLPARASVCGRWPGPERLTIDLDATLITSHSEKQGAAGTFKRGFGFHPMLAYADETGEALAGELRPGNAGANPAADQIAVAEQAVAQIPA